jgi:hypothetical protein
LDGHRPVYGAGYEQGAAWSVSSKPCRDHKKTSRARILPNEVRVFLELRKENPDTEKIVKLGMRNIYFAGSQTIFQIAIIFVMAYLAVM